jgi:DNA mismatch repair protein MutS
MSELRIILKMADKNSLILGDELCSGTETESALSIFVAGLMDLTKKQSSFIFATHFHEILKFDEITSLSTVSTKHMAVRYDRENDCLIYDRKLRDGSGPRTYGLEVCKSLYLEDEFLEIAYSLRNKYYPETKGSLSSPTTIYNAKKVKGTMCENCGKNKGEEIHHLQQQKDANDDGFIGSFHKNHPANLEYLCQECHDKIHSDNMKEPVVRKKTTRGYKKL